MDHKKIEAMYNPATCAEVVEEEIQQSAEISKIALKFATQQNAFFVNMFKKALEATPFAALPVFELAVPTLQDSLAMQNNQVDLAAEQGTAVVEAVLESGTDPDKAQAEFSKVVQSSWERSLAVQNSFVEFATKQMSLMYDSMMKQPGLAGTGAEKAAEITQHAYENVLQAQQQMLKSLTKTR